jgi:hypothetical protein
MELTDPVGPSDAVELADPVGPSHAVKLADPVGPSHAFELSDHVHRALTRVTAVAAVLAIAVFLWTVVAVALPPTHAATPGRPAVFASAPDRGLGHPAFGPLRHAEQAQVNRVP